MIKNRLYLDPENGKLKGVCAGIANYLDIPVKLVRVIVVLSLIFGLFVFTVTAYIVLAFVLEPRPYASKAQDDNVLTATEMLNQLRGNINDGETQLRDIERYVTSDTFGVRSRFRQL